MPLSWRCEPKCSVSVTQGAADHVLYSSMQQLRTRTASLRLQSSRRFAISPMSSTTPSQQTHLPTGYLYHELYFWHNAGCVQSLSKRIEAWRHWENPETKRRYCRSALLALHNDYIVRASQSNWNKLVQVAQLAGCKRPARPLAPLASQAGHRPRASQVGEAEPWSLDMVITHMAYYGTRQFLQAVC